MALIERIQQMRQQGLSDDQITKTLLGERFTPVQIQEAFSQSSVKNAVAQEQAFEDQQEMQASVMQAPEQSQDQPQYIEQQYPTEQPQYAAQEQPQYAAQEQPQYPTEQPQYAAQEQPLYTEGEYQEQPQYAAQEQPLYDEQAAYPQETYYQQAIDLETVRDIAEQTIEENLGKLKKELDEVIKVKTNFDTQLKEMDNRLKRIEETIQELQSSILGKIGNYGEAIEDVSKELKATQDSFAKLVNPIIDQKRGINTQQPISQPKFKLNKKPSKQTTSSRKSKSSSSFEDYFR